MDNKDLGAETCSQATPQARSGLGRSGFDQGERVPAMGDDDLLDSLTCCEPEKAWGAMLGNLKERRQREDDIAERLDRKAKDLAEQANEHHRRAQEFHNLVIATERAPVTFPVA